MAETLGSMADKLSIKSIREMVLRKKLQGGARPTTRRTIQPKLNLLKKQKKALLIEIDDFVKKAAAGQMIARDEKLKLYNKPEQMNRIKKLSSLAKTIEELTKKNLELWGLEDEARLEGASLSDIGRVKRKIDAANQQRNDLIDKVDEIFSLAIKKHRSTGQRS